MNKIFYIILFSIFAVNISAQDVETENVLLNKKGQSILPKAGDFAIGIDMVPFMNYLGNFSNNTSNNSYNTSFLFNENTVLGKYYLKTDLVARLKVKIESHNQTNRNYVQDDAAIFADPLSQTQTVDEHSLSQQNYMLGVGLEKNRGRGRLKGIYGAEVFLSYGKNNESFTYGNSFSDTNTAPTRTDFGSNYVGNNVWVKSNEDVSSMGFGANAFVGVQYFLMPDICLGTELAWGGYYNKGAQNTQVQEYWNNSSSIDSDVLTSPGDDSRGLGLNNPSIGLYLLFHF